jgi:DNA invertase Pin-like site-specific DNA recombinase
LNVVFYGRYSDASQTEQSIEGQRKVCYEWAERNGYKIIAEYIDRALSGTEADNRPEFQRMIADSAKRQFQGVLVYQLDRFARNRYDSATHKNKLKKNGVKVLSAKENITDDASGVLMEAVLEGMAEYFSVELSQKVKRGMALTAQKCEFTGAGVPLGYKIVDKKYAVDPETAPIVKRIFEMYLGGMTMAEIIRYLNENGVKTSFGNAYNKNSIRRILKNRRYLGIYKYNDIEIPGGVPQIVDEKTFADAQVLLEKNKKAPARLKALAENYLLTTKLFCQCGSPMTGESGHSRTGAIHQYYKCNTARKHGDCKKKPVKKAYIEDKVIEYIMNDLTDEKINDMATKISALSAKDGNTEIIKRLKDLLKENEEATANLIRAIETGKAVEMLTSQIEKRQAERTDLEAQLAVEKMIRPVLTYDDIKFFFEKLRKGDTNDYSYRVILMDVLVERIYLYEGDDPRLEIYCRASDQKMTCPINEPQGSFIGQLAPRARIERATLRLGDRRVGFFGVSSSVAPYSESRLVTVFFRNPFAMLYYLVLPDFAPFWKLQLAGY